jgi:hypothetical protein
MQDDENDSCRTFVPTSKTKKAIKDARANNVVSIGYPKDLLAELNTPENQTNDDPGAINSKSLVKQ